MERLRILEENAALGEEMQKLIQEKDLLQSKTVETVRTTLRFKVSNLFGFRTNEIENFKA